MSKIVILLFAVLVASAADASRTQDQFECLQNHLQCLQNRFESYFATEIDKVEEEYNSTKTVIREKSEPIYNDDINFVDASASANVYAILNKAQEETRTLISQINNTTDLEECHEIASYLNDNADFFLSTVLKCTERVLRNTATVISIMEEKYKRFHSSLIDGKNRIGACCRKVNNAEEVARAISCTEAIENETKSFVAQSAPRLFVKFRGTKNDLTAMASRLANCLNRYPAFQTAAADLMNRSKACYQQKIAEAAGCRQPAQ